VLRRFPALLRELTPTMRRLEGLADSGTPVLDDLTAAAPGVNRATTALTPLAREARPWVRSVADVARDGRTAIRRSRPAVDALGELGRSGRPLLRGLAGFLESFRDTGGMERLLDLVYVGTGAMNGFDEAGHFIRSSLVLSVCVTYAVQPGGGSCLATFQEQEEAPATAASARRPTPPAHPWQEPLVDYLLAP
jgi:hypothetical protein